MTISEDSDNYGDQTNEQVVQMNAKIMCRSHFDIFMNSVPQSNANKKARDRAQWRIQGGGAGGPLPPFSDFLFYKSEVY